MSRLNQLQILLACALASLSIWIALIKAIWGVFA